MGSIDVGTVLGGKYRLEKLIGQGGMGSVWRAEHLGLHAPVAVKLLGVDLGAHAEAVARFHREAHAAASIRSPHVVQILDHGIDEATKAPFIVMELMEGQSLADRLAQIGRVAPADVARIFVQVARALSRAHEAGIVHRDLKPDNVFLVRNEDEEVAKVLDFGIAKARGGLGADSATRTGAVMGTAYYMSPEQISGAKELDFRTDLWAFGVMACECLTGRRPFDADSIGGLTLKICVEPIPVPSSFQPVPPGFDAWFARITQRPPAARFGSAREAADTLRKICLENPALAPTLQVYAPAVSDRTHTMTTGAPLSRSAPDALRASPKQSRAPTVAAVASLALIALGGAIWLKHARSARDADASTITSLAAATTAEPVVMPPSAAPISVIAVASAPASAEAVASAAPSASAAPARPAAQPMLAARPHSKTAAPPAAVAPAPAQPASAPKATPTARDVIDDRR